VWPNPLQYYLASDLEENCTESDEDIVEEEYEDEVKFTAESLHIRPALIEEKRKILSGQ
jgi:putative IMPACT (imprinted ancient) family translation regulator